MRYSDGNLKLLRNRDKMKDDAIAQLSDQLLSTSTRLEELGRKQSIQFTRISNQSIT
jgi:hypothetical protein